LYIVIYVILDVIYATVNQFITCTAGILSSNNNKVLTAAGYSNIFNLLP